MTRVALVLLCLFTINAMAAGDLTGQMDALGANKDLMRKAKAVDPQNRIRVVQNREVDRNTRLEFGLGGGLATGGDAYTNTSTYGAQLDFHIVPQLSLGARYNQYSNSDSVEGRRQKERAETAKQTQNTNFVAPGSDYASRSWLAVANWYPIYGKLNLLDSAIAQFDIYLLGGAGQITLQSGNSMLYTAGGGIGVWMSQHVSLRTEVRWQGYKDDPRDSSGNRLGARDINQTLMTATLGFLF
jgi:outer membrane immunogenic protein